MGFYLGDIPLSTAGKSAYQQAVEGGYTGSEEDFKALLNSIDNKVDAAYVKEQGDAHNTSTEAHADIRTATTQALTDAKSYTDTKLAEIVHPDEIAIYEATIGTTWEENSETGVKTQTVALSGVASTDTADVDCVYQGDYSSDSYTAFVEQQNQFLTNVTNGFAETVDGGIKFTIFGDANTVEVPIMVRVTHHAPH